jgi:hypothetical protein
MLLTCLECTPHAHLQVNVTVNRDATNWQGREVKVAVGAKVQGRPKRVRPGSLHRRSNCGRVG